MIKRISRNPYSEPEAEIILVFLEDGLAQSQTETIIDDPEENDWDD